MSQKSAPLRIVIYHNVLSSCVDFKNGFSDFVCSPSRSVSNGIKGQNFKMHWT